MKLSKNPFPLCRLILEGDIGPFCPYCKSSFKRKWFFFKTKECGNYKCQRRYSAENILGVPDGKYAD